MSTTYKLLNNDNSEKLLELANSLKALLANCKANL